MKSQVKYSSIWVFMYSSIQVFKYSSIQVFQVFKYSSIQAFKYLSIQVYNLQIGYPLLTNNVKSRDPIGSNSVEEINGENIKFKVES